MTLNYNGRSGHHSGYFQHARERTIQILGEVQNPGVYPFSDNMTLKDMIFTMGGFTEAASESFIELARRHIIMLNLT